MSWINQAFIFVLLGSLTGICFSLGWFLIGGLTGKRNPKLLYVCLKIVMLFYVLPVTLLIFSLYYHYTSSEYIFPKCAERFLFEMTPLLFSAMKTIIIVWFLIVVSFVIHQGSALWRWHMTCKGHIPEEDVNVEELFEEVCKKLGVEGKVGLVRNDLVGMPMISGVFHPVVILPCQTYELSELEMIFTHELVHYKQKDLWIKFAALMIVVVHCFNPCALVLRKHIDRWSEITCDIRTCELLKDKYTAKQYYTMILKLVTDVTENRYMVSPVTENSEEIKRRITYMKLYQKTKKMSKRTVAAWVTAFTVFSMGLAVCASGITAKAQEQLYDMTMEENAVVQTDVLSKAVKSEVLPADANVIEMPLDWNPDVRNSTIPVSWSVKPNTYLKSTSFALSNGDKVMVSMAFTPNNKVMKAGIIYPNGAMYYVSGTGTIQHTFTVTTSGSFRFYLHNQDASTTVSATRSLVLVTD